MVRETREAFSRYNMQLKAEVSEVMAAKGTVIPIENSITLESDGIDDGHDVKIAKQFTALSVTLDNEGNTMPSVFKRLNVAELTFRSHRAVLRKTSHPPLERIRSLHSTWSSSVLFGCTGWFIDRKLLLKIQAEERTHLRDILRCRWIQPKASFKTYKFRAASLF